VNLRGEVDLSTRDDVQARLDESIGSSTRVVLDLSEVTFLDSSGLSVLVELHRRLGQNAEAFVVQSPSPPVRRVLALSGLDQLLTVRDADGERRVHPPLEGTGM
jgi:anti-sigma B factor antagonist